MRRLPIYFVIDVSESMIGDPLKNVEDGMRTILTELKRDPHALETVWVSVIVFAGKARTLVPLTDIVAFYPPKFPVGSGTSYGVVLKHLMDEINNNVRKSTYETKGDWKPIIFFMTDGNPTDNYVIDLGNWEQNWKDKSNTVVISLGDNANSKILRRISDNILSFDDTDPESYKEFFKWVTSSIKIQSQKVDSGSPQGEIEGVGFDESKLKKIDPFDTANLHEHDDLNAIFFGKCQNKRTDYIVKYKKSSHVLEMHDFPGMSVENYRLNATHEIDSSYDEMTDKNQKVENTISTEHLRGMPTCPSCGNRVAMAVCSCGGIFCVDDVGMQTCPHCRTTAMFGAGPGHIDLNRQQG